MRRVINFFMKSLKIKLRQNTGQTLIETMAAIFILTMGVTAAVGLANFALQSSTSISKQVIATGLAREGIEAVKNMRDTNWLQQTTIDTDCWNFVSADQTAKCYTNWLGDKTLSEVAFCLNPTSNSGNCNGKGTGALGYFLGFDYSQNSNYWVLSNASSSNPNLPSFYGLLARTDSPVSLGYYYPGTNNGGVICSDNTVGISDYCRKIFISLDFSAPYNHPDGSGNPKYDASDIGPKVKVQSVVWWKDKNCPRPADGEAPRNGKCVVELDEYLTNWKNY